MKDHALTLQQLADALQILVLSLEAWNRHAPACAECEDLQAMTQHVLKATRAVKASLGALCHPVE